MDPNATLRDLDAAIKAGDKRVANCLLFDLKSWLRNGGLAPTWTAFPEAAAFVRGLPYVPGGKTPQLAPAKVQA